MSEQNDSGKYISDLHKAARKSLDELAIYAESMETLRDYARDDRDFYQKESNRTRWFDVFISFLLGVALCGFLLTWAGKAEASEDTANRAWCAENNGKAEVRLEDGTRVDCLLARHAVEAEHIWSDGRKWYESGLQSIHYARLTNRLPGVLFIVDEPRDCELLPDALQAVLRVRYWTGRRWVPVTVWVTGGEC